MNVNDASALTPMRGPRNYSPTQRFFLHRMQFLLQHSEEQTPQLTPDDWRQKLLARSLYSTYCDCVAIGVGDEAQRLSARFRQRAN